MTDALIKQNADMVEAIPGLTSLTNPPDLKWPRLRCYFFIKNEDPTKSYQVRGQAWCVPDLRELYYDMDKDRSRKASRLALPQLLNEINVIREPQQAGRRIAILASNPDLFRSLMEKASWDNGEVLF